MQRLTKTYIEKLPKVASGKQAFYWDSEQRGLGLRVTSGSKSFIFQQRVNGKSARITIGAWPDMTAEDARERARKMAVMIDDGIDPRKKIKKDQAQNTTLGQCFAKFLSERKLKPRTRYDYNRYLNTHLSDWLDKPVNAIDSAMIMKRYKKIAESRSGSAQASSVMRALRSIINHAQVDLGKVVIPENPVVALTAKRAWIKDNARTDHLRLNEIRPFVEAVRKLDNPVMASYLEFILLTGARRSEAALLRWRDVEEKARVLTFKDTKNKTDRTIPITPRVAELLTSLKKGKMGNYVFATIGKDGKPTHISEPRKAIRRANDEAASAVTVHGLRRTYATALESLDCPAYPLKALLGHSMKGDVTTNNYTQISVERVRPWAEKYETYIRRLVGDISNEAASLNGSNHPATTVKVEAHS